MTNYVDKKLAQQLKLSIDLREKVRSYLHLKEVPGSDGMVGLCPFHEDSTPSFRVYPDHYHCFGCGAHGDLFDWMEKILNIPFAKAVEGILESNTFAVRSEAPIKKEKVRDEKLAEEICKANEREQVLFQRNLRESARRAQTYLHTRGVSRKIWDIFGLGYADGVNISYEYESFKSFDVFIAAGLIRKGKSGDYYDTLRNRITFPLIDAQGLIRGFAGRLVPGEGQEGISKYINPTTTEAYSKREFLYGIPQAAKQIELVGRVWVVEGYMDVIRCHIAGLKNVVSCCGTSLSDEHLKLLSSMAREVCILFDGDKSGLDATAKLANKLLFSELDVTFYFLTDNEDPDTFLSRHAMEDVLKLPHAKLKDFHKGQIVHEDIFENPKVLAASRPYVEDNIKKGLQHYNVIDWVTAAYPEFAHEIKSAIRLMKHNDFSDDSIKAFLRAWKKPCAAVRKAQLAGNQTKHKDRITD